MPATPSVDPNDVNHAVDKAAEVANHAIDATSAASAKLQPILSAIADEFQNLYHTGKEFAKEEIPQLAKEIVYYGIAQSAMYVLFSFVLIGLGIKFLSVFWKHRADENYFRDEDMGLLFLMFITLVPGVVTLITNLEILMMAVFAPRLYLINQAVDLVSKLKGH